MKILFIGQRGIPAHRTHGHSDEERVEELAARLAGAGHAVTVLATKPYGTPTVKNLHGIIVRYVPTFHPQHPGGLVSVIASLAVMWRMNPDVVHMHGWRAAAFVRLAALLCPETTFVWTVTSLPQNNHLLARIISWQARHVFDAIVTPTRELQYHCLNTLNLRTQYIPDGYAVSILEDIPASQWGLRRGQYVLMDATKLDEITWIAQAYKLTRTKKKLAVLLYEEMPSLKRLQRKYPFLVPIVASSPRARTSLVRQAAAMISATKQPQSSLLLVAMDAGCPVVAANYPLQQEVLGITGVFAKAGDIEDMARVLNEVIFYTMRQKQIGTAAQKRARNHFGWARILEEYLTVYHYPEVKRVPIDSIRAGARTREKFAQ